MLGGGSRSSHSQTAQLEIGRFDEKIREKVCRI